MAKNSDSLSAALARLAIAMGVLMAGVLPCPAAGDEPAPRTVAYKTVGDTKIELDVYRPDDTKVRPVLVWIHGGALINGSRKQVPKDLLALSHQEGYALVSIDYRLAPETKLPAIIEDVQDAFRWIRGEGAKQFHLDPQKLVVAGGSAGGYLTMMTGFCVEPRPAALVAYYGYGDLLGDWYTKPSEHYRQQKLVPEEEARQVGKGPPVTEGSNNGPNRFRYYLFLRQNGLWTKEVGGFDPQTEPQKFAPYCPVQNVDKAYPPILMLHGTADTDVPYEQSAQMAQALATNGRPHELITLEGGGHGLREKNQATEDAYVKARDFIRNHLK